MTRTRREFIGLGVGGVATVSLGAALWREMLASSPPTGQGGPSYGTLRPPDANGIRLPYGFESRVIARGREAVADTGYRWHEGSDGAAAFPTDDGGWILVSNSEVSDDGGASAIRFSRDGEIQDAYRILSGTERNCSGGGTPWGTWLSCEEVERGSVWECDPTGRDDAIRRPAMGVFQHEAAAVDPHGGHIYMTEDLDDGRFYRFTPDRWPHLGSGRLEVATVGTRGATTWTAIPDPSARETPTRYQVPRSTPFKRAEGIWFDDDTVFVATTTDSRVRAYDIPTQRFEVLYDGESDPRATLLNVDQLTATSTGEIFVCEDNESAVMDIGVIDRAGRVAKFLSVTGPGHRDSEPTGVVFDPGEGRMYFASQWGDGAAGDSGPGIVYEVTGPFRRA